MTAVAPQYAASRPLDSEPPAPRPPGWRQAALLVTREALQGLARITAYVERLRQNAPHQDGPQAAE